jgi:hypothetical protein
MPSPDIGNDMGGGLRGLTYNLSGAVTDPQGHPLDGAHIIVLDQGTARVVASAVSFPNGSFEVSNLPAGQYIITATSGLYQVQKQVDVNSSFGSIDLQIPVQADSGGVQGGNSVSVKQFEVPKKARKLLQEARKAYQEQKRDEAIRRTDEALKVFPDFSEALTFRAVFYLQDEQGEQARTLTEKAVHDDPTYGLGYVVLGAAYNMLTRFDDALRVLGRAFSFTPQSWQGHYESARAHLGKNQFDDALDQINKAAQNAPKEFTAIYLVRAQASLGLKKYGDASAALKDYLKADPHGSGAQEAQRILNDLQSKSSATMASE